MAWDAIPEAPDKSEEDTENAKPSDEVYPEGGAQEAHSGHEPRAVLAER